ncbi:hypothetical protein E4U21_003513 [Claviceps maximensis]|nr:hypothetical protein E4U21_003513 [Claviceps maximensis]
MYPSTILVLSLSASLASASPAGTAPSANTITDAVANANAHANANIPRAQQPRALVYRGPAACKGCPEAVAKLLQDSPQNFAVTFVGPNEDVQISADTLSQASAYAQPGGPDLRSAYRELESYQDEFRDFVQNGGRYLGFCLGAFLAGSTPGFQLLPAGINAVPERKSEGAQVTGTEDTMIQVDWTYQSSQVSSFGRGETAKSQWLYFQDGAVITGLSEGDNTTVLGRYSSNGNVAASLTPLGKGIIALVGPHPEAPSDWYRTYRLENPDGIKYDIGYDFVNAAMDAAPFPTGTGTGSGSGSGSGTQSTPGAAKPSSSQESASQGHGRGRLTLLNPIGLVVQTFGFGLFGR